MNAKRKFLCMIAATLVCSVMVLVGYVRMTWITQNAGQVIVRMPTCTLEWQVCQQIALGHLSDALNQYPTSNQYQIRWSGQWLPLDDTDYFDVTYNRPNQDLTEVNVGQADMDRCNHVTDRSIRLAAKTKGGFDVMTKYGAKHLPL